MARTPKKPPPRPDDRARREFVDTATGAPVKPVPARRRTSDGAAPTGRIVAEVDGTEVPLEPGEVLSQEGTHPREQRFDYDPADVGRRAKASARAGAPRKARAPSKPRELRATFDTPKAAAKAFFDENAAFFDNVRDPHDGLRDWLRETAVPPRDSDRVLALRGAPAIRAALAIVFGRARGRRWDAVERRDLERLGAALEPYYEAPDDQPGSTGITWWPTVGDLDAEAFERLPPAKRAQAAKWEAHEEIREGVSQARALYESRRPCMNANARAVIERRLAELERWRNDSKRIPGFACEPDERAGGYTCNYPAIEGEIRAIRSACADEGYDPDWSTPASRAGEPGFPDTSRGPADPRLEPIDHGAPTCMRSQGGRSLGGGPDAIEQARTVGDVLYQREWKRCGNSPKKAARKGSKGCRCYHDFPKQAHGPYWNAYFVDPSGRTRSKYIGREFRELTDDEREGRKRA